MTTETKRGDSCSWSATPAANAAIPMRKRTSSSISVRLRVSHTKIIPHRTPTATATTVHSNAERVPKRPNNASGGW